MENTPNNNQLKEELKTIDIKGRPYVQVASRIKFFNENYPNGMITSDLLTPLESKQIMIKATVTPDMRNPDRKFTGYSQEIVGDGYINKTSALENCETSAVGRALAMMGIGIIESIASSDEVVKAQNNEVSYTNKDPMDNICEVCGSTMTPSKSGKGFYCFKCWKAKKAAQTINTGEVIPF